MEKNLDNLFASADYNSEDVHYWLVGSYWPSANPRERLPNFREEAIWVNGHGKNKFADRVDEVQIGDILICKSTYAKESRNYLKIKSFGKVTGKSKEDGSVLIVDWDDLKLNFDIKDYGFYRDTIQLIRHEDLDTIIDAVKEAILDSEKTGEKLFIKHALSIDPEDGELLSKKYENQGLIGYIDKFPDEGWKQLFGRYLMATDDYQYVFESKFGEEYEGKAYDLFPVGYVSGQETKDTVQLRRFFDRANSNHIYCSNPNLKLLSQYGFVEESNEGFENAYLFTESGNTRKPLYVYSTEPELLLFFPLKEAPPIDMEAPPIDMEATLWSDAATENDEFGRESLVRGVVDSVSELFETHQDAYTILLNGEWGTGKSSMLKFFDKQLSDKGWHIINYNAWENQSFKDPWWILINAISKRASKENLKGDFSSHSFWKFRLQYRNKVIALALMVLFGVSAYYFSTSDPATFQVSYYVSLVGLVGSVITVITGIANSFFFKSVSNEDLKEQFTDHPFKPIRERFNQIAENNKLAIFIDDLDRCEVNATVVLLEGIQNLFKGKQVLYIVAADGQWVSNCFNERYNAFQKLTNDGCSIGDKFLQKSFQLTMNVPKPNPEDLKKFWDRLVGAEEGIEREGFSNEQSTESSESASKVDDEPTHDTPDESTNEMDKDVEDEAKEVKENIEHYLGKFLDMGVPDNPRQMKRFINQYVVMRQTMVVEGTIETYREDDRAVKFLIFSMRFPSLANQLKQGELTKQKIFNSPTKKSEESLNLTKQDIADIKELLEDINESLMQGEFYSF
ncbi:MAG: hypothetical protein GY816_17485 [Cytophagales bacterium]|nr:hypothetical protein [Cytophagales bacterium]